MLRTCSVQVQQSAAVGIRVKDNEIVNDISVLKVNAITLHVLLTCDIS